MPTGCNIESMIASPSVLFFLGLLLAVAIHFMMTFNCLQNRRNTVEDEEKSEIRDHEMVWNELGSLCGLGKGDA